MVSVVCLCWCWCCFGVLVLCVRGRLCGHVGHDGGGECWCVSVLVDVGVVMVVYVVCSVLCTWLCVDGCVACVLAWLTLARAAQRPVCILSLKISSSPRPPPNIHHPNNLKSLSESILVLASTWTNMRGSPQCNVRARPHVHGWSQVLRGSP